MATIVCKSVKQFSQIFLNNAANLYNAIFKNVAKI